MKRLFSALTAVLFSASSATAATERWSFGPFSVDSFVGYSYKEGRAPAVYTHASGSAALITVHLLEGKPNAAQAQKLVSNALQFARSNFESAAAKYGQAAEEFSSQDLPSGDKLATLPVQTREQNGTGYLLQFAVISSAGHIAIITVEGRGSVKEAANALMPAIRSARFAA